MTRPVGYKSIPVPANSMMYRRTSPMSMTSPVTPRDTDAIARSNADEKVSGYRQKYDLQGDGSAGS